MPAVIDEPQTFSAFQGKVAGNSIKGISLLQKGPALGHGVWIDDVMLSQAKDIASDIGKLKAKQNHWSGIEDTIGFYENFRIKEGKLLADLNLFESAPGAPLLLEMIDAIPGAFGVSISFAPDQPAYDKTNDRYNARMKGLYSGDFVDTPAANRDGVFNAIDNPVDDMPAVTIEQFDAYKIETATAHAAALEAIKAEFEAKFAALNPPAPPAPAPDPADSGLSAQLAALAIQLKAFQLAPVPAPAAPPVNDQEQPAPVKAYAVARKEAIGTATGLARINAFREFEKLYASEAAYNAAHSAK